MTVTKSSPHTHIPPCYKHRDPFYNPSELQPCLIKIHISTKNEKKKKQAFFEQSRPSAPWS